jgi:hypothetical protein
MRMLPRALSCPIGSAPDQADIDQCGESTVDLNAAEPAPDQRHWGKPVDLFNEQRSNVDEPPTEPRRMCIGHPTEC